MTARGWTADDLPDLTHRTAVVTGATSGLGLATARALARAGAEVVLAVRDTGRGDTVAADIGGRTLVRRLDLADLASVRCFAEGMLADVVAVDVLVDNAGVMAVPEGRTRDGFELQIGTNHLGHFALTNLLLPVIRDRVVVVSSQTHRIGRLRLDDLNIERRRYQRWTAYAQSKLANLLFVLELDRRLAAAGSPVRALAAHPGYAATGLQSHTGTTLQHAAMALLNKVVGQSAETGALSTLYAATQDLPGGSYVGPSGVFEARGHPRLVGRSAAATDAEAARALWELSEKLTGVRFPWPADAA